MRVHRLFVVRESGFLAFPILIEEEQCADGYGEQCVPADEEIEQEHDAARQASHDLFPALWQQADCGGYA